MRRRIFLAAVLVSGCQPHAPGGLATVPDSNHALYCELDPQCPAGSHCQAGVCDLVCFSDADCPGQSCDPRGRCGAATAQPAVFQGRLVSKRDHLDFDPATRSASARIENDGTQAIDHFHAVSDNPAVRVSPARGTLPSGQGLDLAVQVDPGWVGRATVHVLSSGGVTKLAVSSGSTLLGHLQGQVSLDAPYTLGTAALGLDLTPGPSDGANPMVLAGVVDAQESLLWAFAAPISATDDGANAVIRFTWVADPASAGNPRGDGQVQREVTLTGSHSGSGPLSGAYQEIVRGYGMAPVTLRGTFSLQAAGAAKGLVAAQSPAFAPTAAPAAFAPATCPDNLPGCPSDGTLGTWLFGQAFPFETWGPGSSLIDGRCQLASGLAPQPCLVPALELPAAAALVQNGGPAAVWEVLRAEASDALLEGNDRLANILEPEHAAYAGPVADAQALQETLVILAGGLHGNAGLGGALTPDNLWRAQASPPVASQLDLAVDDQHRFGGLVQTLLFAGVELIDRLERTPGLQPAGIAQQLQTLATAGLLEAAALSTLRLDGVAAPGSPDSLGSLGSLSGSEVPFGRLAVAFARLRQGLNPVGYAAGAIPFDFNPAAPSADLFAQMLAAATPQLQAASALEDTLRSAGRSFEQSSTALQAAVLQAAVEARNQVVDLCGAAVDPATGAGCGQGGAVGEAMQNYDAAQQALLAANDRGSRAAMKVDLLEHQLQNEVGQQAGEILALQADGTKIALAAKAKAEEEIQALFAQCAASAVGFFGTLLQAAVNPAGTVGSLFSGGANTGSVCFQANNSLGDDNRAYDSASAQSDQTFQIQVNGNLVRDDTLSSAIFDAAAEVSAAAIEARRQFQLCGAAYTAYLDGLARLAQALDAQQAAIGFQASHIDPTFRLLRDQTGLQFAAQLEIARKWVFLATRAFEYQTNQSYARGGDVWTAADAAALAAYLASLQDAYATQATVVGWDQSRLDVISVRRDILGILGPLYDPVLGLTLSEAEQFRSQLALPKNRDPQGNLALTFSTDPATGGRSFFSTDVCLDRIADLKMNVVSGALQGTTAYFGLSQAGAARLADCQLSAQASGGSSVTYALPSKASLVAAGLNLPPSAATDPALPASTDLFARPVLAQNWTLSLDQQGDPRNAWIDLAQVDDLEIWVHHQATTKQ